MAYGLPKFPKVPVPQTRSGPLGLPVPVPPSPTSLPLPKKPENWLTKKRDERVAGAVTSNMPTLPTVNNPVNQGGVVGRQATVPSVPMQSYGSLPAQTSGMGSGAWGGMTGMTGPVGAVENSYPEFQSVFEGPNAGDYTYTPDLIDPTQNALDTSATDLMWQNASVVGDSPWASLMKTQQGLEESNLLGNATNLAATTAAGNRALLASRGGLRGGAGLRLSNLGGQNAILARQGVRNQGALSRADIGIQDQARKDRMLEMIPGLRENEARYKLGIDQWNKLASNQGEQFNIGSRMAEKTGERGHDLGKYSETMKALAAASIANAIKGNAGGGGNALEWLMSFIKGDT